MKKELKRADRELREAEASCNDYATAARKRFIREYSNFLDNKWTTEAVIAAVGVLIVVYFILF